MLILCAWMLLELQAKMNTNFCTATSVPVFMYGGCMLQHHHNYNQLLRILCNLKYLLNNNRLKSMNSMSLFLSINPTTLQVTSPAQCMMRKSRLCSRLLSAGASCTVKCGEKSVDITSMPKETGLNKALSSPH